MKKLIIIMLTGLFFSSCVNWNNLTEEQKQAYRKSNRRYWEGQKGTR